MSQVRGRIVLVQEDRFRLLTDAGQGYLLTLAHNANLDAADLRRLQQSRTPVLVEYQGEPNLDSAAARSVRPTA